MNSMGTFVLICLTAGECSRSAEAEGGWPVNCPLLRERLSTGGARMPRQAGPST